MSSIWEVIQSELKLLQPGGSADLITFNMEDYKTKNKSIGRNIAKIRNFKGIKQEALAHSLGVSQQAVSQFEKEVNISDEKLLEVANALGVTPEIIKHFDEEKIFYYINTVTANSVGVVNGDYHNHINPTDKLIEVYERLLASEKEKIELLKKIENAK
nr:helix-turn-helix domain-containing protein [Sphingobacterium multivorum]